MNSTSVAIIILVALAGVGSNAGNKMQAFESLALLRPWQHYQVILEVEGDLRGLKDNIKLITAQLMHISVGYLPVQMERERRAII